MKRLISATLAMLIVGITFVCLTPNVFAGDGVSVKKAVADKKKVTKPKSKPPTRRLSDAAAERVRTKARKTMAALVEAEAAKKPNEPRIKRLQEQLEGMCERLQCSVPLTPKGVSELKTTIDQTMAMLAEAKTAEKPDEYRIKRLNDELESMRAELPQSSGSASGHCMMGGSAKSSGMRMGQAQTMRMRMMQKMGSGRGQSRGSSRQR